MRPESTSESQSFSFDNFLTWLYMNRILVAVIVALILAAIVAFAFSNWKKRQDEAEANAALFALPSLIGPGASKAQAESFQKIANEYPGTRAGEHAELLAAGVSFTGEKYAEAEKQFSKFLTDHAESPLRAQAALGVAASLEAQGKTAEAITKYQELIARYPGENVISPAKLTLARLHETQSKPEEALKLYDDLARSNNPYDPWGAEARERREQLLEKFPNLKPKPPVAITAPPTNTLPTNVPVTNNAPAEK